MSGSVFGTADVKIDVSPVFISFFRDESVAVVRVHVAEVVCRRAGKSRHGAELEGTTVGGSPVFGTAEWWLAAFSREELVDFRELEWQEFFRKRLWLVVLVVINREWLTPISLTAEDGVAEAVVNLYLSDSGLCDEFLGLGDCFFHLEPVEAEAFVAGVGHDAFFCIETFLADVAPFDKRDNREVEVTSESIVAAVVGRHCHNCAGTVSSENVVADVDRNLLSGNGIYSIRTAEHTRHFLVDHSFAFGFALGFGDVFVDSGAALRRGNLVDILAFGREDHECDAENSVGTSGENQQVFVGANEWELHFGTFAVSNPVSLSFLERVGPVDCIEATEQTTGVCAYAKTPLVHEFLLNGITAADREAFAHLVVGEHCSEFWAPVYHRVAEVGNTEVHKDVVFLFLRESIPLFG